MASPTSTLQEQEHLKILGGTRPHALDNEYQFLTLSTSTECPHITFVSLNRPHKRNAIHAPMWIELGRIFATLGRTGDGCRCILLCGQGPDFCAGIDYTDPTFLPGENDVDDDVARAGLSFLPKLQYMQECFTAMERSCPIPVVSVIHGKCIGAGVDLICCSTIRICTPCAIFSVREVALGLAADIGTLQRLPKLCGNQSMVQEACLTGFDFGAQQALAMGLVSRISETAWQDGWQVCRRISEHSPVAVQGTKTALLYARDHSVQDGLDQIANFNMLALQGDDLKLAWMAKAKKRRVRFKDLAAHSKL